MSKIIVVQCTVTIPIQKVWQYWIEPAHILRWNNASEDWSTLKAENDLQPGGKFNYTMAANDGSFSFDFSGVYTTIEPHKTIKYTLDDGRKVEVTFMAVTNGTEVLERFEPENENSRELQQQGWQAILNNFKKYVEADNGFEVIQFSKHINAPAEKVYSIMLDDKTYREWAGEFNPTSHYKGSWNKGSKILFVGNDEQGNASGMVSLIRENIPNRYLSIAHLGLVSGDKEIVSGPEVEGWTGSLENYTFKTVNGGTMLEVDMDANKEYKTYFEETWPRALTKLKTICENS